MGTFSIWHWLIVGIIVLLLFGGGGKIPKLMRDVGQGVNSFKKGLKETKEDDSAPAPVADAPKTIDAEPVKRDAETASASDNAAAKS